MRLNKNIRIIFLFIYILFSFNIISCSSYYRCSRKNNSTIKANSSNYKVNDYFKESLNNALCDSTLLISNIKKKGNKKSDYINYLNIYKKQIEKISLDFTNNTQNLDTSKSKELISIANNMFNSLEESTSNISLGIENNSPKKIAKGFLSFLNALHNLKSYYVAHYENKS